MYARATEARTMRRMRPAPIPAWSGAKADVATLGIGLAAVVPPGVVVPLVPLGVEPRPPGPPNPLGDPNEPVLIGEVKAPDPVSRDPLPDVDPDPSCAVMEKAGAAAELTTTFPMSRLRSCMFGSGSGSCEMS